MAGQVLVTGSSVAEHLLRPLTDAGLTIYNPDGILSESELGDALSASSAYLLGGDEVATADALEKAKDLRVISFLGVGYESFIDVKAASSLGIPVTNTPGTLDESVAEFAIGLLLNLLRRIPEYSDLYRAGASGTEEKTHDLAGTHVGIVGLGAIGSQIARTLRLGFNCPVSYFSRTRKPDLESELSLSFEDLASLIQSVDALILMLPGNETTTGLITSDLLRSAKPGLKIVNAARPELIESKTLLSALKQGFVSAAAFDGFYGDDDLFKQQLLDLGPARVTVTGHIASLTHEARDGMAKKAVGSILSVLSTGDDEYIVNSLS